MNSFRLRLGCVLFLGVCSLRAADTPAFAPSRTYPTEVYAAVGSIFARDSRVPEMGMNEAQLTAFLDGIRAAALGKPYVLDKRGEQLQREIIQRLQEIAVQREKARLDFSQPGRVQSYLKETAKQYNMQVSDSGLVFNLMPAEGGFRPGPDDTVVVSCEVAAADQKTALPQLAVKMRRCKVSELIPGLAEGVQMLTPGGRAMLAIPPELSYGTGEWPAGVERGSPLLYTLVLHEVVTAH